MAELCTVCKQETTFYWTSKEMWIHPTCYVQGQKNIGKPLHINPNECPHGFEAEIKCPSCRLVKGLVPEKTPRKPSKPPIERNSVRVSTSAPATSKKAAERALPNSGTKRRMIYDAMVAAGEQGVCDHELEQMFGWVHQSASAARNSLMNDGWCEVSTIQRMTPQGNMANAYVAVIPKKCFIDTCTDPATQRFFGKDLCSYHHQLSGHGD
jgi:hypothetical protein